LFIIAASFLISCSKDGNSKQEISNPDVKSMDYNDFLTDIVYDEDIIPNENIALKYADFIFENTLGKNIDDYKNINVYYDAKNEIWLVNYSIDVNTVGGDTSIAISKKTGEIVNISFGE
jgi:hypothetical protein